MDDLGDWDSLQPEEDWVWCPESGQLEPAGVAARFAGWEGPPPPDTIDDLLGAAMFAGVFAAQQLEAVDRYRREAILEAGTLGILSLDLTMRSVRLEIAAALRITERMAAGCWSARPRSCTSTRQRSLPCRGE